jgi:hypothetical protein
MTNPLRYLEPAGVILSAVEGYNGLCLRPKYALIFAFKAFDSFKQFKPIKKIRSWIYRRDFRQRPRNI